MYLGLTSRVKVQNAFQVAHHFFSATLVQDFSSPKLFVKMMGGLD